MIHRAFLFCFRAYTKLLMNWQRNVEFSRLKPSEIATVSILRCDRGDDVILTNCNIKPKLPYTVAVTGLPEPQANHAVIMARFAADCLVRMNHVVKELETELGPGTGDLTMRFGVHSGPVTAGVSNSTGNCCQRLSVSSSFLVSHRAQVLRGDRSRFQLVRLTLFCYGVFANGAFSHNFKHLCG